MRKKMNEPFDVTYTISFSGRTVSDGIPTTTTQMIRDKLIVLLEECISKGYIRDYSLVAERNNIAEAEKTLKKSKT